MACTISASPTISCATVFRPSFLSLLCIFALNGSTLGLPDSLRLLSVEGGQIVQLNPALLSSPTILTSTVPSITADVSAYDPSKGWLHLQTSDRQGLIIFDVATLRWSTAYHPSVTVTDIFVHPTLESSLVAVSSGANGATLIQIYSRSWSNATLVATYVPSGIRGLVLGGAALDSRIGVLYLLPPWRLLSIVISDGSIQKDVALSADCFSLKYLSVKILFE